MVNFNYLKALVVFSVLGYAMHYLNRKICWGHDFSQLRVTVS